MPATVWWRFGLPTVQAGGSRLLTAGLGAAARERIRLVNMNTAKYTDLRAFSRSVCDAKNPIAHKRCKCTESRAFS